MLWFLAFASKDGLIIDSYVDEASGVLEADAKGLFSMTKVVLRPKVTAAEMPAREVLEALHHRAHESCFLARSVTCSIQVEL